MKKEIIIDGLWYGKINDNEITFTTDTPDFKPSSAEEAMEILFNKFGIDRFQITIHHHNGETHDKDIQFKLKKEEDTEKIMNFILKEFYSLP